MIMLTLTNFTKLNEEKAGKNLHLEHIEDEIINNGVPGGRAAINFLQSLRDMLAGNARSSINMTVKWDGAPAIFAVIDPSDGKFFVAKKSVFNVNPKLYKTAKEIDDDLKGALVEKFKVALAEFSKLNPLAASEIGYEHLAFLSKMDGLPPSSAHLGRP